MKVGERVQIQHWFKHDETPEGWSDDGDVSGIWGQYNRFITRPDNPDTGPAPRRGRKREGMGKADDGG